MFGKTLDEAWADWIAFEKDFQRANLAEIREEPVTQGRHLSDQALGSISRAYLDTSGERLYAAFRYPGVVAHIGEFALADGSVEHIEDVKGPMLYRVTSLAHDPDSRTVFYTTDNYAYRDLRALDLETGKSRMLFEEARIGELVFNRTDRSIWGVRHLNGIATLVRIPHPYTEWNQVISLPYGELLYDLDVSPDGRLLSASFGQVDGNQSLRVFEIDALLGHDLFARRRVAQLDGQQQSPALTGKVLGSLTDLGKPGSQGVNRARQRVALSPYVLNSSSHIVSLQCVASLHDSSSPSPGTCS